MGFQNSKLKRAIDIAVSLVVLILSTPILILAAVLIKLETNGPVFFIHPRTGKDGRDFNFIKFRGMVDKALNYGPVLTQKDDPRITKVGRFLRRTSIDEIPNFINVLMGDMSIIGPRPEMTEITRNYTELEKKVFEFKPGITGISQVNGRQMLTPTERVLMEIDYYSNESISSDLKILFKTFKVVFTNEGNI